MHKKDKCILKVILCWIGFLSLFICTQLISTSRFDEYVTYTQSRVIARKESNGKKKTGSNDARIKFFFLVPEEHKEED